MKKLFSKASAALLTVLLIAVFALSGCDFGSLSGGTSGTTPSSKPTVSSPQVVIGVDGLAVWGEVSGAILYVYTIDGGEEQRTAQREVRLEDGQTIRVKALSNRTGYLDSEFSAPLTYHAGAEEPVHDHVDVNRDEQCDVCGKSVVVALSFYAVNDLHGRFIDSSSQCGVDEFTTYMKNLYNDPAREEILLSSGDMWQGTAESSLTQGKLMTEWMNDVGFVSMTLGNHEFDWGNAVFSDVLELAEFPLLAINVRYNGVAAPYCQPSVVVERAGVKVGIIGAIGNCLSSISGEFSKGLNFATGNELTNLVKTESARLRDDLGCDFIVYSIHDGSASYSSSGIQSVSGDLTNEDGAYYDVSLSEGYVDLVFEAHTHRQYIVKDEHGVYHLQGGGENSAISCADVTINLATDSYEVTPRTISSGTYGNAAIPDDPIVEELFEKYFSDNDPYDPIGTNRTKRAEETVVAQVARLYYEAGLEKWSDYTITLGGGYLSTRKPYSLAAGQVTYADIFSLLPFNNEIVLGSISGKYLKSRFLNSKSYTVYPSVSSANINDAETYYIVVDSFTSSYSYNHITEIDRLGDGIYARDLFADYIKAGSWA